MSAGKEATRQVEFYLSDSNLPFDKYLFGLWAQAHKNADAAIAAAETIDAKPEKDSLTPIGSLGKDKVGWIPLEKITSFKRMEPFLKPEAEGGLGSVGGVAAALEENTEGILQVARVGDQWFVRRAKNLAKTNDSQSRSVYAKGFPVFDGEDVRAQELQLQKDIEDWARSLDVGAVKSVRLRREAPQGKGLGKFKGSVFIEFDSPEAVGAFLALDAPKLSWNDAPLNVLSKEAYVEGKKKEYENEPKKKSGKRAPRPFNAWSEHLIEDSGVPVLSAVGSVQDSKKRAAEDEKEIEYDGVTFTVKKTADGITVVDVEEKLPSVGKDKLLELTVDSSDFDYNYFKSELRSFAPVAFVDLVTKSGEAPAKAHASFKEPVTDDALSKITDGIKAYKEANVSWRRPSADELAAHARPRVQRIAEQAFDGKKLRK